MLVYDEGVSADAVFAEANRLVAEGKRVRVSVTEDVNIKYKSLQRMAFTEGRDGK